MLVTPDDGTLDGVRTAVVLLLAVALDLTLGDPPNRWHPVAWMGAALERGRRVLCAGSPRRLLVAGAVLAVGAATAAAVAGVALARLAGVLGAAGVVLEAAALSTMLSLRGLARAGGTVAEPLARGDVVAARAAVGLHLVSRPTATLDREQVASAAVESVAENLTDAFVAPVLYYLVLGLPGVTVHRMANTADAMLGYREGSLEWFGKASARLDDLLNVVPARLAGLCLVMAAGLGGGTARAAWRVMWRDARRTASPNAGWTMAAMAGALGARLEKVGAYRLGDGAPPAAADVHRSVRIVTLAAGIATLAGVAVALYCDR